MVGGDIGKTELRQCLDPNRKHINIIDAFEELKIPFVCFIQQYVLILQQQKESITQIELQAFNFHKEKERKWLLLFTFDLTAYRLNHTLSPQNLMSNWIDWGLLNQPTSSSSIGHNLNGLQDLYDCVDKLLQLSLSQQSLSQEQQKKCVQELLDGSLVLLDMCSVA